MWLVVGLGNPGRKYAGNRHNIGFRVVDELVRRHALGSYRSRWGGETASGLVAGQRATVLKPMEFMNLSGYAVSRAVQYLNLSPEEVVVIHDEADFEFAKLKLKNGGGHGGHNGLRSIIEQLGEKSFLRVRVGVGKPAGARGGKTDGNDRRVASYLLSDFSQTESAEVEDLIGSAADATEAILKDGIKVAMNEFNRVPPQPEAEPQ